jgi:hypothetical protein
VCAAGVVVVQVRHHHHGDVVGLEAEGVEPMDQQVFFGEAGERVVADQPRDRAR